MAASAEEMTVMIQQLQAELAQSQQHVTAVSSQLEALRAQSDQSISELRTVMNVLNTQKKEKKPMRLCRIKNLEPGEFDGKKDEPYKKWAKGVRAYCESEQAGFREALEWAEKRTEVIDADDVELMTWEHATVGNGQLYSLLESLCIGDALLLVEKSKGLGFEAWRALKHRHNPTGGRFELDRLRMMLGRTACKSLDELPTAADRLEKDLEHYASVNKEPLPEALKVVLFQSILP